MAVAGAVGLDKKSWVVKGVGAARRVAAWPDMRERGSSDKTVGRPFVNLVGGSGVPAEDGVYSDEYPGDEKTETADCAAETGVSEKAVADSGPEGGMGVGAVVRGVLGTASARESCKEF